MSVLIKGMEMPNKKSGAVLIIYPDGKCAVEDGSILQAVELPPHGRLIDADVLADQMAKRRNYVGRLSDPLCLIEDAPTIIEAEGDNE